jgi:hypothetical protein
VAGSAAAVWLIDPPVWSFDAFPLASECAGR